MGLILITNDLYDVACRLRGVLDSYTVYYNTDKNRFEVHDSAKRDSLEFVVPYDELDARTVEYARYSRVENAEKLFAEIEEHNRRLEKENASKVIENTASAIEDGMRLATSSKNGG